MWGPKQSRTRGKSKPKQSGSTDLPVGDRNRRKSKGVQVSAFVEGETLELEYRDWEKK